MKLFKTAILSAALISAAGLLADAAEPAPTNPATPQQVANNPGIPYSAARPPGLKVGPSNWIPSPDASAPASPTGANPGTGNTGGYYSGKGFGPKPN